MGQGIEEVTQQVSTRGRQGKAKPIACLMHLYPAGPAMGTRHLLDGTAVVIGRDDHCDVTIHDRSVSRQHSRIELVDGVFLASDLGSTNGTTVNDAPADRTVLADGDYLGVGNCLLRFLAGANVEASYRKELYRLAILNALTGMENDKDLQAILGPILKGTGGSGNPLAAMLTQLKANSPAWMADSRSGRDLQLEEITAALRLEAQRPEFRGHSESDDEFEAALSQEVHAKIAPLLVERFRQRRPIFPTGDVWRSIHSPSKEKNGISAAKDH